MADAQISSGFTVLSTLGEKRDESKLPHRSLPLENPVLPCAHMQFVPGRAWYGDPSVTKELFLLAVTWLCKAHLLMRGEEINLLSAASKSSSLHRNSTEFLLHRKREVCKRQKRGPQKYRFSDQ